MINLAFLFQLTPQPHSFGRREEQEERRTGARQEEHKIAKSLAASPTSLRSLNIYRLIDRAELRAGRQDGGSGRGVDECAAECHGSVFIFIRGCQPAVPPEIKDRGDIDVDVDAGGLAARLAQFWLEYELAACPGRDR